MTAQQATARPFAELDGCPRCGAHRWEQHPPARKVVVCGECNTVYHVDQLKSITIGRD